MARTYSQAEVDALVKGGSALDAIAARPYHTIVDADGTVLAYPPTGRPESVAGHNGPNTVAEQHPDDYFNVETDDKGEAKLNDKGQAVAGAPKAAEKKAAKKTTKKAAKGGK